MPPSGAGLQGSSCIAYRSRHSAFYGTGLGRLLALTEVINAGGDTDSNGAILGSWLGALHGEAALPQGLIERIHDGPFGPTHLRALAGCLGQVRDGKIGTGAELLAGTRSVRNLALHPVVIGHGFRRLLPF